MPNTLRDIWKHLRLPFQMTLAPIFLWGYFLARPAPDWKLLPAFAALHLCLYTGVTAYNSYYDRDEGPVGGLEHPPAVHEPLYALSLFLQGAGLLLALPVGASFVLLYLIFMALSVLYSHPRFRWKARPGFSAFVVCGGQGGLGFLAGWAAARGEIASAASLSGVLGGIAAACTTFGMYPLTQVYQVEEDRKRGDITLCVLLGVEKSLRLSQGLLAVAGASAIALMARCYTPTDALLLTAAYAGLIGWIGRFRKEYARLTRSQAFHLVLLLNYSAAVAFALFIGLRLVRWI
jgi:1,4-dihydroxy-2-naphthoate octaprenyltransferase